MIDRPSGDQRDEHSVARDGLATERGARSGLRDTEATGGDALARERDDFARQREQALPDRLWAEEVTATSRSVRESSARQRIESLFADRREQAADRREQAADRREQAADRREARQTVREPSADLAAADERDRAADARDHAADERDRAADAPDRAADERDRVIDNARYLPPTEYPAASVAAANRYPIVRVGSAGQRGTDYGWASLTDGELPVVAAVAQGMSNRRIAKELHLSRHTVDAHLKHVYLKLDIHTRVQLTVLALQHSASLFTAHRDDRM